MVNYAPVALAAIGGIPPYQWTVGAGALPTGLTLSPDGNVTGTPAASGNFDFTAHVADTGGRTADAPATIAIVAGPSATLLPGCARACSVEQGCDSSCGPFGTLSGGTAPFNYTLVSGYIPQGVSLSGLALVGTFTAPALNWRFTVLVTDALGAFASISPIFYVYPHISLAGGVCSGDFATGCTVSLPYYGGTPGGSPSIQLTGNAAPDALGCWSPSGGPPPTGSSVGVSGRNVVVTIPANLLSGYGAVWTLVVTDQGLCGSGSRCTSPAANVSIRVQCG